MTLARRRATSTATSCWSPAASSARSLAVVARDGDGYVALASFCAEVPRIRRTSAAAAEAPGRLLRLDGRRQHRRGQARAARILSRLQPADRFSLSRFGSHVVHDTTGCSPRPSAAPCARRRPRRCGGWTPTSAAPRWTRRCERVRAGRATDAGADVLLITDGEIWDADALVARGARRRSSACSSVGIGSAPAEGVLRRLADGDRRRVRVRRAERGRAKRRSCACSRGCAHRGSSAPRSPGRRRRAG